MLGSLFADSHEEGGVNGLGTKEQYAKHLKKAEFVGGVESVVVSGAEANWSLALQLGRCHGCGECLGLDGATC